MAKKTPGASEGEDKNKDATPAEGEEREEGEQAEDEGEAETTTEELDLDKELEEEERRGRPDPKKAHERIVKKRSVAQDGEGEPEEDDAEDDLDQPMTRREAAALEDRMKKDALTSTATTIARALAASDKEAQLIVAKWRNRTFPQEMVLQDQIEECYAITHRKRLIGERNEALRAAGNRANAGRNAAETHRDGAPAGEPKMPTGDKVALQQAGFVWDAGKRLYKKQLGRSRGFLYKDVKTGRTFTSQD